MKRLKKTLPGGPFHICEKLWTLPQEAKARLLMSTPAVGPIVALTYASAIDDPGRFKSSKRVGAHFGLTPRKYQSGQTDC